MDKQLALAVHLWETITTMHRLDKEQAEPNPNLLFSHATYTALRAKEAGLISLTDQINTWASSYRQSDFLQPRCYYHFADFLADCYHNSLPPLAYIEHQASLLLNGFYTEPVGKELVSMLVNRFQRFEDITHNTAYQALLSLDTKTLEDNQAYGQALAIIAEISKQYPSADRVRQALYGNKK